MREYLDYIMRQGQGDPKDVQYTPDMPGGGTYQEENPVGRPVTNMGSPSTDTAEMWMPQTHYDPGASYYVPPERTRSTGMPDPSNPYRTVPVSSQTTGPGTPVAPGTPNSAGMMRADVSNPEVNKVIREYITQAAQKRGIDPTIALEIADREGGTNKYEGNEGVFDTGKSYWAYQLHYGGAGTPWAHFGRTAGMGNDFSSRYGYTPGQADAWQQAIDFALDGALRSGWVPWASRVAQPTRGLRQIGDWEGIPQRGR